MDDITKIREIIVKIFLVLILACAIFGGCNYLNKQFNLPDDHPAEQFLEAVIEQETGLDIDLTP